MVDYKLRAPKEQGGPSALMYAIQLMVYAYIAERRLAPLFPKKIGGLYLLYFSPDKSLSVQAWLSLSKLSTSFTPRCVPVDPCAVAEQLQSKYPNLAVGPSPQDCIQSVVETLLEKAVSLLSSPKPPASASEWATFCSGPRR
ncbi:MAG: hypothetical protein RML92_09350 [Bacteroidia bacterium]|nr:hypothetical protein [Bacteroidia bacterium]